MLSGSYPAFFLSAYEPVEVLKGNTKSGGGLLRKGLVICQFAMSILLIIGALTVYRQLAYLQNKNLGFNKEQLITLPIFSVAGYVNPDDTSYLARQYQTVKQTFLNHPNILSATAHRLDVTRSRGGGIPREIVVDNGEMHQIPVQEWDETFLDTYEVPLLAGRNFSKAQINGSYEMLINETAARLFSGDPLGLQLQWGNAKGTVVGVIKDFHFQSLRQNIAPYVIINRINLLLHLSVRIKGENLPETIAFLEKTWKDFLPNQPFQYAFIDDNLNRLYREDQRVGQLVSVFALLAILVACLGLFGLAAFTAEQRTKEIGVRKVLGASVQSIVLMLSKEFAKLILIANLIAWPVAYFATNDWLQNFAYRTDLAWWVFALGGLITLTIALCTVGYQAIRAAISNPIDALRYE